MTSPGITETGNVHIYANGTVSNTSAVKHISGTNIYDLLVNINGTLSDQKNNSVVNGNGMTLNGGSSTSDEGGFISFNTTGVTLENAVIATTSYYGVQLGHDSNTMIDNVSTVNYSGYTPVLIFLSNNVTIENSNFSLASPTYAINAEYDYGLNLSNNLFTGSVTSYFVYFEYGGAFEALNNTIMSTSSSIEGIYLYYSGPVLVAHNRVNNTLYAIDLEDTGAVTSMYNTMTNNTYAFYISADTSFTSLNDTVINGEYPMYDDSSGPVLITNGNFTSFSGYLYFGFYSNVSVVNSQIMSAISSSYGVYFYKGGPFNLIGDSINLAPSISGYAVYSEYVSGWASLVNDHIFAPNGYGLYLSSTPLFRVTGSYMNVTYGVYDDSYAVSAATITNNVFVLQSGGYALYTDIYETSNVNFSNNSVSSLYSSWSGSALYLYSYYTMSNITVLDNTIMNSNDAIEIYSDEYGSNVLVSGNMITNSSYSIEVIYYFSNVSVTSNTIINVTNEGIYIYTEGANVNVSNNLIENMPSFGGMSEGIDVEEVYGGTNIISHNTVINAFQGYGMYITDVYGAMVYSNVITTSGYAFYIEDNNNMMVFGNTISLSYYDGIYSNGNVNISYYSNTITNANESILSENDYNMLVFANTFTDTQTNYNNLYFLYIEGYTGSDQVYHNNLINNTKNSVTSNYFSQYQGLLVMYKPLPVGGNYYSNYTGTGSNGIGSTPVNFMGGIQDKYPLLNKWTSPTVTFLEKGLPSGTPWSIQLGSKQLSGSSSGLVFQQTNGQYATEAFTVSNVPGYTASVASGTVKLDSSSSVVTVNFSPVTYTVTLKESGLASGTSWSATLNGKTRTSTSDNITFSVSNGSYTFTVGSVTGYTTGTTTGSVSVSGSAQTASVQFTSSVYTLTVKQSGLPAGDSWSVTVAGKKYNSTGETISIELASGTYNISASAPSGYTVSLQSTSITIDNSNGTANATFAITNTPANNANSLYAGIGIGGIVGAAAGLFGTMFYTGTGVFRRPGK